LVLLFAGWAKISLGRHFLQRTMSAFWALIIELNIHLYFS